MSYIILVVVVFAVLFCIHSVFPTYYNKRYNKNIIKTFGNKNEILLTFDDGPDKRYTNKLLDVLLKNNVRATFFVVAQNAEKSPEIIKRMIRENHVVGLHSKEHKNAWLYSHRYAKRDFLDSIETLKGIGVDAVYYRPPWGHTNIFSCYLTRQHGLKTMLWDVMAEDWEKSSTKEAIKEKLLKRTHENAIICLHDAGDNSGGGLDAPLATIAALEEVIPILKSRNYRFITPEREK